MSPDPRLFDRHIGVDYSGAKTSDAGLRGLRVYVADGNRLPVEARPRDRSRVHWTRRGIADWLGEQLAQDRRTIVGIDHGFSFPRAYFERYALPPDWRAFLEDFRRHWPTDRADVSVEDVRRGRAGCGRDRRGEATWRRLTEKRTGAAKSVFHFDVPGAVAKSTHAGLPWLRSIVERCAGGVHVWPFDGWDVPDRGSVLAEVYPRLWRDDYARGDRCDDRHDAFVIAAALRDADRAGRLGCLMHPALSPAEWDSAQSEGWILGVC